MRLTKLQQRTHRVLCLQFDRATVSRLSDEELRWAVASAAAGNHDGERCAWPYRDRRSGVITAGPLPVMLQAVAEEVVRRVSYPPGHKLPPVELEHRRQLRPPRRRRRIEPGQDATPELPVPEL